jgi:hypothetical protein
MNPAILDVIEIPTQLKEVLELVDPNPMIIGGVFDQKVKTIPSIIYLLLPTSTSTICSCVFAASDQPSR